MNLNVDQGSISIGGLLRPGKYAVMAIEKLSADRKRPVIDTEAGPLVSLFFKAKQCKLTFYRLPEPGEILALVWVPTRGKRWVPEDQLVKYYLAKDSPGAWKIVTVEWTKDQVIDALLEKAGMRRIIANEPIQAGDPVTLDGRVIRRQRITTDEPEEKS